MTPGTEILTTELLSIGYINTLPEIVTTSNTIISVQTGNQIPGTGERALSVFKYIPLSKKFRLVGHFPHGAMLLSEFDQDHVTLEDRQARIRRLLLLNIHTR